jgi:HlyD family secretion protein
MPQVIPPPHAQNYAYLPPANEANETDRAALHASVRGPMLVGLGIVLLLVASFGIWAATAPLAGGAVAPGVISPDGSRKTVQHLEGGIIGEIMVRDGDFVTAGNPLVTLEDTQTRAAYDMLLSQHRNLRAVQTRLTAEQLNRDSIDFPKELLAVSSDAEITDILDVQRQLFATRRDAHASSKGVLEQRIRQIRDQIRGLEAQLTSSAQRVVLVDEELKGKVFLYEKGLIPKPQLLAVYRARAEVDGSRGQYEASIAQARERIGETELELVSLDAKRADEISRELDKARTELSKVKEQLGASKDALARTVITAPVSGTVVNLHFKTRGGVIQRGQPILDIVPANDDLLIDARVALTDIDVVHPGLPAYVHLSAYTQRSLPQIEGRVLSISADSLRDEPTGTSYYRARVEVDREQLSRLGEDIKLIPGMPAEVLIVTGERTLFGYLLQPFRDLFRRSLREI